MNELGQFLERFYRPEPTFRTVRARVCHRRTSPSGTSAARRPVVGRRKYSAKPVAETEETIRIWAASPAQIRLETLRTKDGRRENTVEVSNEEDTWKRFADGKVERDTRRIGRRGGRESLPTEYRRHFDNMLIRQFFAALTLEANGSCCVAGRQCLRIRAVQVPESQLWPHWLAWEAEEFEFAADIERAVLLSIVGKVSGESIEQHDVQEVAFDEELDKSLFSFEMASGETANPATPVVEHITPEAARSRVAFTILQPTWSPESDRLQRNTMYHPARPDHPDEHVSTHYRGGTSFDHLWINQRSGRDKRMDEELEWDIVELAGRPYQVSDPGSDEGLRVVVFQQDGTHVAIVSDLGFDDLLRIAVSFESMEA